MRGLRLNRQVAPYQMSTAERGRSTPQAKLTAAAQSAPTNSRNAAGESQIASTFGNRPCRGRADGSPNMPSALKSSALHGSMWAKWTNRYRPKSHRKAANWMAPTDSTGTGRLETPGFVAAPRQRADLDGEVS